MTRAGLVSNAVWLSICFGVGGGLIFLATTPELSCRRDDGGRVDCEVRRKTLFELLTLETLEIRGAGRASTAPHQSLSSGSYATQRVLVEAEGGSVYLSRLPGRRIAPSRDFAERIDAFLQDPRQRSFHGVQSPWDWTLLGMRVIGYLLFSLGVLMLGSPALNWLLGLLLPQIFASRKEDRAG